AAVALLASVGALRSRERPRRLGLAIVASFGLLLAVMTLTYPFRASGRILSGARMAMAWMPLLLLLACTLLSRRGWARALALAATVSAFFAVDVVHLRQAREWKADNARRQARLADFLIARLDAYRPRRIVMRSNDGFVYGLRRFPVEVVWPLRSAEELSGLEARVPFDFVVVPLAEPMDYVLNAANARYELMDAGRGGRWRVWRRRY
ncbi:MAG TPA: hypothetical protein VMR21_15400, partial [Vicinamibacteria bacterium]|nr:hypothetical protein [Vicinamibacteria bacterium]